jgi:predicted ATP-grasp superfamily ATP-dependent carboligase
MSRRTDPVLVLDANGQAGLHVVRSLGRRGVAVTAGSSVRNSLGRLSRYSDDAYRYPDIEASPERFLDNLIDYLERTDHFAVVPVADMSSVVLSKHKAEIEATGTRVAGEDWDTFEAAWDKGRLFALTESLDVPAPRTIDPSTTEEVAEIAPDLLYPVLVKPRSKISWDESGGYHRIEVDDSLYVHAAADLVPTYRRVLDQYPFLEAEGHYPLVQEYIDGSTTATVVIATDGEVTAAFQEERVRTHPASGGNSTLLRARSDTRMHEYAAAVIGALNWTGPAMVEFMETPAGEYYLIEVNGRYWGSLPFAITCGVDFPWLHYRQLRGLPLEAPDAYATDGLQQRLVYGDLKWLLEQLEHGNFAAPLHVLWASIVADVTFVSLTDPVPTLGTLAQMAGLGARTAAGRLTNVGSGGAGRETDPQGETPR